MNKDFDIDQLDKKTPYQVPDAFFEKMQSEVMGRVQESSPKKRSVFRFIPVISAAAAVLTAVLYLPLHSTQKNVMPMTQATMVENDWIEDLSDEDLEFINDFSEYDIFMK